MTFSTKIQSVLAIDKSHAKTSLAWYELCCTAPYCTMLCCHDMVFAPYCTVTYCHGMCCTASYCIAACHSVLHPHHTPAKTHVMFSSASLGRWKARRMACVNSQ